MNRLTHIKIHAGFLQCSTHLVTTHISFKVETGFPQVPF